MAPEVAERCRIPRAPIGSEPTDRQLTRLLDAHAIVLAEAREIANGAAEDDDLGTSDIMVSEVIRTGELEVWFLSQHLR
jgi:starvation-inducible DNA-binding protein